MEVISPLGLGQQPIFVDNAFLEFEQGQTSIISGLVVFAEEVDVALDSDCYAVCPMIVGRDSVHEKKRMISDY
jgi:hypothetical protein